MPEEEYSPLKELILDSKLEVVRALSELCHADRSQLANSLLRIFRFDKKEADLLSTLNRLEVDREDETTTLFRGMYGFINFSVKSISRKEMVILFFCFFTF